ncbi:MAG: PAS domain-containing protein, partial [Pseudomonadota bacterium]
RFCCLRRTDAMDRTEELERLVERLDIATQTARIAVWEWDCSDDSLYWSPVFFDILGLDPVEFGGKITDLLDRLVPEDRDRVSAALTAHLGGQSPYDIEYEMQHRCGRRVAIAATGQARFKPDGMPDRMIGTLRDISERRTLEEKLLRAESIGKIGHWELDLAENRLTWSPQTFRIHGLSPSDPQPSLEEAFAFYHPDDVDAVAKNFGDVIETGHLRGAHARLKLRNGDIRHIYADGIAYMRDGSQRPTHIFGILHDRTEFVEQQEQLRRSQRLEAIGQLAGGIAHDFNNLLAVIYGNLDLLAEADTSGNLSRDERRDVIATAKAAARSGADLTKNMLAFASKSQLAPQTVCINDIIRDTEGWLSRTLPASIRFSASLKAANCYCKLDPSGLQSALINVVVNARDAMPDGGRLEIETRDVVFDADTAFTAATGTRIEGAFLEVIIQDTGVGIEPQFLDRVFEPFVTTKPLATGTGLGLSMVQGFMRQSKGAVDLSSVVGAGTRVRLLFPIETGHSDADDLPEPEAATETAAEVPNARILVVEDQPEVLALLVRMLTSEGYDIEAAASGDQAIEIFRASGPFDLLLTDVIMPGALTGPKLALACRETVPDLPVIFLTGYSSDAMLSNGDLPPDELRLMKPVPRDELLGAIKTVLERARHARGSALQPAKTI